METGSRRATRRVVFCLVFLPSKAGHELGACVRPGQGPPSAIINISSCPEGGERQADGHGCHHERSQLSEDQTSKVNDREDGCHGKRWSR